MIQEGFRIRTSTPLGVPRGTLQDVNLMGYHIPKNTQVRTKFVLYITYHVFVRNKYFEKFYAACGIMHLFTLQYSPNSKKLYKK